MRIGQSPIAGIVTGCLMIITSLLLYHFSSNKNNQWQMLVYGIYAAGIWIGQYRYTKSEEARCDFRTLFSEGFKIFMPVTLLMVLFTWLFIKFDPTFIEQTADAYKNQLITEGNRTPEQIQSEVAQSKDKYATFFTSLAIFGYLIAGALATLSGAVFFGSRNNK